MNADHPQWEMAVIFNKINLLYFTGTMPNGMLIVRRDKEAILWVRRSFERSQKESLFSDIRPMNSYRDAAKAYTSIPATIYLETEFVPLAMYQRFQKYFPCHNVESIDYQLSMTRAIKSDWELDYMQQAGKIHQKVLEKRVPELLHEGISEMEFATEVYRVMIEEGHMGIARFNMFDTEMVIGQIGFGESSIYPTSFDGPGGNYGLNAAMPGMGSRRRLLKKGDMVFVDMGLAVNGYHTDKTLSYQFGQQLPDAAIEEHYKCVAIQNKIAEMLKPGTIPADIYDTILNGLSPDFMVNFMGFGNRQTKFLGHAIGLTVDEIPVIAKGFNEPLQNNMTFALEPKKGIAGVGMVGIENTFIVTPQGGKCITGTYSDLMKI
jgi:Xaa-Pro aminopeptidase